MRKGKGIVPDLDKGFYEEARVQNKHPLALLTDLVNPEPPEINRVENGLLGHMGVTREQCDRNPVLRQNMADAAYLMTGLSKEMEVRGIRGIDTVENAFFSSANGPNQPLFPVWLASQIIAGQLAASLVPYLCATAIPVNAMVVDKVTITDTAASRQLGRVAEGALLPKITITRSNGSITMQKYGGEVDFTYEVARLLHLDVISLQFQRIGVQAGIDETDDLIETALNGDGNASTGVSFITAQVANTLTYDELVRLFLGFGIGYQMRHAIVNDTLLRTILNMAEFKDPMAGFRFVSDGVLPGPMGASWHRWTSTGSATFGTDRILAVDNRYALGCYNMGDMLEESDQLIDRQIYQRTMSYFRGYMKYDNAATQALKLA